MNKSFILALTSLTMVGLLDAQNLSSSDKSFIETAAKNGMHEVHMGQIGVQKASSDKVKRYAQMIIDDHTKANAELNAFAQKKGVNLPSDPHAGSQARSQTGSQSGSQTGSQTGSSHTGSKHDGSQHGDMMNMPFASKTGKDFDMAYTMAMVEDHQKEIATFEKASQTLEDAELKAWATKALPTLKKHLEAAETLHKSSM